MSGWETATSGTVGRGTASRVSLTAPGQALRPPVLALPKRVPPTTTQCTHTPRWCRRFRVGNVAALVCKRRDQVDAARREGAVLRAL